MFTHHKYFLHNEPSVGIHQIYTLRKKELLTLFCKTHSSLKVVNVIVNYCKNVNIIVHL